MQFNRRLMTCRTKKNINYDQTQQSFLTQRVKKNLASLNTMTAAHTIDFNNMAQSNYYQSSKQIRNVQKRPFKNNRGSSLHILGRKCPSDYGYTLTPVISRKKLSHDRIQIKTLNTPKRIRTSLSQNTIKKEKLKTLHDTVTATNPNDK